MNDLIEYIDRDLYIGTWKLSKLFKAEHRVLKNLVYKYRKDFEEVGEISLKKRPTSAFLKGESLAKIKPKIGRPVIEFLLNEPQATYLIILLRNQDIVRKFKKHITIAFFKQRKLIAKLLTQKQNVEWLQKRAEGKLERRVETDTIKKLVEYAKALGSKSADTYYMNISKMENHALFHLDYITQKYPNIRDVAEGFQLDSLKMADRIVAKAIKEGLEKKLHYKDIYKLAKNNVLQFAKVLGKTPLQISINETKEIT